MKKALLLLTASIAALISYSQNSSEIKTWVCQHPDVHLISEANYAKMSEQRKDQLKDKIIVYKNEITMEQLNAYAPLKSTSADNSNPARDADLAEIKEWLAMHDGVKIIKRSYYNTLTQQEQEIYQNDHALILLGEEVTVQDIRNY